MKTRNRKIVIALLHIYILVILPDLCLAKTYAYIIESNGKMYKFDADSDSIISDETLQNARNIQSGNLSVAIDNSKGFLYVAHGRFSPTVSVYNLHTLELIENFDLKSDSPDLAIFAPPNNSYVYIDWFDDKRDDSFLTSFDNKTFAFVKDIVPYPDITEEVIYSNDNSTVYFINDGHPATIKAYSLPNFELIKTISLEDKFTPGIFGRVVDDYKNGIVLIDENWKKSRSEPDISTLYTYNYLTDTKSKNIILSKDGYGRLTNDGGKVIFNETKDILYHGDLRIQSVGALYVYDIASGGLLGNIKYSDTSGDYFMFVHPNGKKVYMSGGTLNSEKLIVVDIENFKVTKTINVPNGAMFFVEE